MERAELDSGMCVCVVLKILLHSLSKCLKCKLHSFHLKISIHFLLAFLKNKLYEYVLVHIKEKKMERERNIFILMHAGILFCGPLSFLIPVKHC